MMQRDGRDLEPQHHRLRARDRAALAVLLGRDARIGARRVDERHEREAERVGELHRAHRLAVALRIRHPEVAARALLDVATLLLADDRDRATVEPAEAGDDRGVVGAEAVAVQLEEVVEQALDVVERERALVVSRELDGAPDLLVRLLSRDPVELLLELVDLARDARAPEQARALELAQAVAQPELGLTRHARTTSAAWRSSASARGAERRRRDGRSGSWTRRARSRRAASRASSAARRAGRRTTSARRAPR